MARTITPGERLHVPTDRAGHRPPGPGGMPARGSTNRPLVYRKELLNRSKDLQGKRVAVAGAVERTSYNAREVSTPTNTSGPRTCVPARSREVGDGFAAGAQLELPRSLVPT